jgi:sn-glycerol 3-phosphate transport system substrate-binding protein
MKRIAVLIASLVIVSACGGGSPSSSGPSADETAPAGKVVEVSFWHGFAAGANTDATNVLIQRFNDAHTGKIHVTATFAGDYDTTFSKIKAAVQANQTPSLVQIYDVGTRFMIDSKQITPMQHFIDKDKYTTDLEPVIANYFSINGKLNSMPWNNSMPLLYINKDAFTAAGLDPNKPPTTLDEIRADAQKLTKKDNSGQTVQYGFGAAIYGWFLEQFAARADVLMCNNGNGRDKNATKMLSDSPQLVKVMDWWKQMLADGLALNTGRTTANMQTAFKAGRVAITLESTGALGGFISGSKFQVGAGPYPRSEASSAGGPIVGGASLWIMNNNHPAYEQRASWEFVKFLEQPNSMAYWHTQTGYFPDTRKSQEDPTDVAFRQTRPQFDAALQQLHAEKTDKATQGCVLGVMPQARQANEVAMEKILATGAASKPALSDAVASIQPAIDQYNQAVGAK